MKQTMFERYGGFASVSQVVSAFYDKVLESPVTAGYFENTDMKTLIDHQTKFISSIMGGPASFTSDTLERVHARLGIDEAAFIEVTKLLQETLEDFGMEEADVRTICDELLRSKRLIVTKK